MKIAALFVSIAVSGICFSQPKLEIVRITENIAVYTTYGSFNGESFPSNGLLLNTAEGVVILDSPWDKTQFQPLLDSVKKIYGKPAIACIATHSHEDRTNALDFFRKKGVATYTTAKTDSLSVKKGEMRAEHLFYGDTTFDFGGTKIGAFYPGPGHTPDNIVLWIPSADLLYGGCFIKSTEAPTLGNLADADPAQWKLSLKRTMKRYRHPEYVIPGHEGWESRRSPKHTKKLLKKFLRSLKRGE
jgi:metallo-beta-lactamase class B